MEPDLEELNSELYEHHRIAVDKGQSPLRIDKYLQLHLQAVSRTKIQAAASAGCIFVNDKAVKSNYKVRPCDIISVMLPEPPRELEIEPEPIPLNIVYEDDDLLVVDKPAGLVVHPGHGNWDGTLLNGLLYHLQQAGEAGHAAAEPFLVHRIDKDTSGLLLVAKNELSQAGLAKQFFVHSIERKYLALVWGDFGEDSGTITGNIGRDMRDRRIMAVYPDDPLLPEEQQRGKHAVTHWRVVERFGYVTLVECVLETGRTHQIRAHMRHIGHPLFNDAPYGGDRILKGTTFSRYRQFVENCFALMPRQALHARILGFVHPNSGAMLHFESPLPPDFQSVIDKWRAYASA